MGKRILRIFLAICMVMALVPSAAFAAGAGVSYIPIAGTGEKDSGEGYGKLLDGKTDTKWCVTSFSDACIIFQTSSAVNVSGYVITTGDDNEAFPGRNPKNWVLYGCNDYNASSDGISWKVLHSISNDTVLQDQNETSYRFAFDQTETAYQYYKLEITEIQSGSVMQMGELALTDCSHNWESTLTPATCTAQGQKETICTVCHVAKKTETIEPQGHDFSGEGGRCIRCSRTEEELYPGVSSYAEKAQLMDSTFAPNSNGTAANIGKLVFGKKTDGITPQEWYILGKDTGVAGENTVIFAANSIKNESGNELAFETDYDINKTDTSLWNDCKYNGTNPTEVYPNHYGASKLRDTLQEMATSNFTAAEQSMMNATTVTTRDARNDADYTTTDKLYALTADSYDPSSELRNTIVKAGSNDQIALAMDSYWNENITGGGFWLRAPFNDNSDPDNRKKALCASLHNYVYFNPTYVGYYVQPAANLNLSSVLFASAATASYDTAAAGTIPSDKAMTLRLDGSDKELGIVINYAKTGEIKATKGSTTGTVSLVVQGREGTQDWYYSKPITGTETVKVSDIQSELAKIGLSANIDLSACRIWLETTGEDGMIYAVNAYKGTERINTTYATKEQLMNSFTPYHDGTVVNTGKLVFGKNNEGASQEWYILGKDDGVAGENTIIFAASPVNKQYRYASSIFSADTVTYDYKAGTGYGSSGGNIVVASNHYGASGLRKDLERMLTSNFTEAEQSLMNKTTVKTADIRNKDSSGNDIIYTTTDKLYALHGNYGERILYAGSSNQTVLVMDRFWGSGDFWLRTHSGSNTSELCAVPGDSVRDKSVQADAYAKPASNLNLSSVLFASAVAASYDAESAGTIPSDQAMTLRLDGSSENMGFAVYTRAGEIKATKESAAGTVSLVVQGNDGINDWYYSKPITGTETVTAADIAAEADALATVDLSACKIWLEIIGENGMIYAVDAAKAISAVEITEIDAPMANTAFDTQAVCVTTGVSSTSPLVSWTSDYTNAGYNTSYTASVTLTAETGCVFMDSTAATVNGNAATSVTKNPDGMLTVTYAFPATAKDKLTGITAPQPITAANGTTYENMNLPTQVNITTEGGTATSAAVTWNTTAPASGSYHPSTLEEQTVTLNGTVICPADIDANGVSLSTSLTITISAAGIVGTPTATPAAGTYTENQTVTLTSSTEGAEIYYTIDGTSPSRTNGTKYTEAISVTGTEGESVKTEIKAIAVKEKMQDSTVMTFTYTIQIPAQQSVGSGGSYVPPAQNPIVENRDDATTSANLSGTTTTSGGTTTANIDKATGEEIVNKAVSNKSDEIVINATAKNTAAADSTAVVQIAIPAAALKGIAEKTEADVTVKTDVAKVKMDNAAAGAVAEQASGDTVQLMVEKVDETADKVEFQLKVVCSDGNVIRNFNGGNVAVTVTIPKEMAEKEIVCVYINDDGRMSKVEGQKNADGTYTFTTGHFSTYALMTEEEADAAIAAQKEETLEALADQKLVARSKLVTMKNGKKAVRITWYNANGEMMDFDGVEIYRSTKKNSGYGKKPIFVIKSGKSSYYNTAIKAGTRYYYKVRGFVIIDGQKYYTDYSRKAIRTAK